MSDKGKRDSSLSAELILVLKESITTSNGRMDKLVDTMNVLAKTVSRSEERHINHTEGLERIGTEIKTLSHKVETYTASNDLRVMEVEKQYLLLEQSDKLTKGRFSKIDNFIIKILSGVGAVGVLVWLGLK